MKECNKCKKQIPDAARFCPYCGWNSQGGQNQSVKNATEGVMDRLNQYMGNDGKAELNWRCLVSDVFEKHNTQDAERIFVCGTPETTPPLKDLTTTWPRPWLYSRVLLAFVLAYLFLRICVEMFDNVFSLPGLIVVGSFTIPITTMVLFLELNAYRNVSFYQVARTFLVGGCASLVVTLLFFSITGVSGELSFFGAIMVGAIEEVGKMIIVYYFIKKIPQCDSILGGLLIGAAVGAGFAAFESSGYAFVTLLSGGYEAMNSTILLRGFLAPGGHVAWAAISGAALIIAKKGMPLTTSVFGESQFWKLFIIPIVLHAIWDMPFGSMLFMVALVVAVWIVIMILVNMGLKELSGRVSQYNNDSQL